MKKIMKVCTAVLAAVMVCCTFAGCGGGNAGAGATVTDNIIEFVYDGWSNSPIANSYDNNPYKKYVDETYGFDFRVSLTSDFDNEVSKRFASTKTRQPDVVMYDIWNYTAMKSLYNQGFFIEDYTPYLDNLPRYKSLFESNKAAKAKLTENGNLIALTRPADQPVWMHKIRKDWVDKYADGKIPETVDELLEMAKKVKADSTIDSEKYLFTASGNNKNIGDLKRLQFMFGDYEDWYVTEDGEVSHPILDGTHEKFLNFCRTIWKDGYLYPNFYNQDWQQKKTALFHNGVGIDYYTPAIATEHILYNNNNETQTDIWINMPMPTDTAGVTRNAPTKATFQKIFVINKNVVKNETKFASLLKFLNDMLYPEDEAERNDSTYMKMRWGVGIDNYTIGEGKEMEPVMRNGQDTGFITYYYQKNQKDHARPVNTATWDYGVLMSTTDDKVIEYSSATKYGNSAYNYIDLFNGSLEYHKTHSNFNYAEMLNISSKIEGRLTDLVNEFEITYIMGTADKSYAEFKSQWLQYGGETARKAAQSQFKAAGLL